MASGWTGDVEDTDESDEEQQEEKAFPEEFREHVEAEEPGQVSELDMVNNIDQIEDEDLLREAWLLFDGEKENIVANRIEELTGKTMDTDDGGNETSDDSSEEDDSETSGGGWGGTQVDEEAEEEEDSSEEESESEEAEPSIESIEEMEDASPSEEDESAESDDEVASEPPKPSSSISVDEATEKDRRWKIMVWGPPKLFKTHFAYTMPEPIAFIDLEGKADDLAKKFQGKNIQIWQPQDMTAEPDTKFRRARKALDEALEWLDWHREEKGEIGTIVVDSMSLLWEWAQIHHKLENYPLKDEEDVELSSNFKSSQESDWAVIKEYHNGEFRERITDSDYHFAWTAMERVDFEQTLDEESGNAQVMEPTGEPKNTYKADTIIHARKDQERGKVGDLTGSNFTDNVFVGLKKPTFPKVRDAIEKIEDAEASDGAVSRSDLADAIGAETVIDYDPQMYIQQ